MRPISLKAIGLSLFMAGFNSSVFAAQTAQQMLSAFGNDTCFIVYDLNRHQMIEEYNKTRCAQQIAVDSTFKIALSLMAFDQGIINQKTVFKWDGQDKGLSTWNQNQTPHTWLLNSAVWVSQILTPQLGMVTIKSYLKKFNYGNQDFSGDPSKNNGLTHAWLSSSLKMSGNEQYQFLKALYYNQLPVSQTAMTDTKQNMFIELSSNGWALYGKTGSGYATLPQDTVLKNADALQDGWFVGYTEKDKQDYLFVMNFTDLKPPVTDNTSGTRAQELTNVKAGGTRAKELTKKILTQMGIL